MKPPAFQFYPSDFLASTAEMSAEEVGVHIRLLCNQWLRGGLPNDDERLRSMAGQCLPSSVAYAKSRYKVCSDGMIRHQRMEEERMKQDNYRKKQAEYGKKRWDNEATLNQPSKVANGSPVATLCPPSPSPSPSLIPTPPPKKERAAAAVLPFPENWTPERKQAMQSWIDYKRERGAGYKPTGWKALCSKLEPYPDTKIVQCVSDSMANNWNGLFPDSMAMGKADRPKNIYTGPVV